LVSALERYFYPSIGDAPIDTLDRSALLRAVTPYWKDERGLTVVMRTLRSVAAIISFSVFRGWRPAGVNPAVWKGGLEHELTTPTQLRPARQMVSLPYSEAPAFFASLSGSSVVEAALGFLILTAGRSAEILGARWEEFDLKEGLWTVPPSRMKGRKIHRVPLSEPALAILRSLPTEPKNPFVFIGAVKGQPLTAPTMINWIRRVHPDAEFQVHGFRSSFRTWAAERTHFPPDVAEAALAHVSHQSGVERAYNRAGLLSRRRQLMDAWAAFLTGAAEEGKVVAFKSR
jgi:integrase